MDFLGETWRRIEKMVEKKIKHSLEQLPFRLEDKADQTTLDKLRIIKNIFTENKQLLGINIVETFTELSKSLVVVLSECKVAIMVHWYKALVHMKPSKFLLDNATFPRVFDPPASELVSLKIPDATVAAKTVPVVTLERSAWLKILPFSRSDLKELVVSIGVVKQVVTSGYYQPNLQLGGKRLGISGQLGMVARFPKVLMQHGDILLVMAVPSFLEKTNLVSEFQLGVLYP